MPSARRALASVPPNLAARFSCALLPEAWLTWVEPVAEPFVAVATVVAMLKLFLLPLMMMLLSPTML